MIKSQIQLTTELNDYILKNSVKESQFLIDFRRNNSTNDDVILQITPLQGQFLSFLVKLIDAKNTLDIGTYKGCSALTIALATSNNSKTISCDINKEYSDIAERYWKIAGVNHKIDFRLGEAVHILEELIRKKRDGLFDFIFIDADKTNYINYYELSIKLVRPGGLIVIDNTLYFGTVIGIEVTDQDILKLISKEGTEEIKKLNSLIAKDERIEMCLLPVVDGLTLIKKR